jgi:hypothetical protein
LVFLVIVYPLIVWVLLARGALDRPRLRERARGRNVNLGM